MGTDILHYRIPFLLTANQTGTNPATVYLASLANGPGRAAIRSSLAKIAGMLGYPPRGQTQIPLSRVDPEPPEGISRNRPVLCGKLYALLETPAWIASTPRLEVGTPNWYNQTIQTSLLTRWRTSPAPAR